VVFAGGGIPIDPEGHLLGVEVLGEGRNRRKEKGDEKD